MIYCLNPSCLKPLNPDGTIVCLNCGTKLIPLLRNRYRIINSLGRGGFGISFLAEDTDKLNQHCVVKQLAPQFQGTSALHKATMLFGEEARRLQQLGQHPQIPTLDAYFEQDNCLYLVQQFIQGQTLRQELEAQGTFSEEKIWELLRQLLPVIKFIHEHQVIHRDIKPENIIRRLLQTSINEISSPNLVLIDFGVAKQLTASSLENPGTNIGSHGYASLEQIKFGSAYPASDLFSLGVTCFHLLTGIHPHRLWSEQGYNWVREWQLHLKISLSRQLEEIMTKLLQKDIHLRYQSADEVLQDLHSQPKPAIAFKTTVAPTMPFVPKRRFRNKLLIGGGILILIFGIYVYWPANEMRHSGEVNTLALNRDGTILVSGGDDNTIKIWNPNNQKLIRTLKGHKKWVYTVAMSQDNQTVISGSKDNTIKIWNWQTGKEIQTLRGHKQAINSVAISPDNQFFASGSYDKTIKVWNLKTGEEIRTFTGHSGEVLSVAYSRDGKKLVSGSADKSIKIWDANTGKNILTISAHLNQVNAIAISPNNQLFVSASDDATVKLWNLNTGKEIRTFKEDLADVNAVAFSPDGEKIATGSDDKTIKIWDITTGEKLNTFVGHSGKIFAVAFSQDGKTLLSASGDKTIKIWSVRY